ncbi:putative mitochondrial protein [Vitis vinifera]|uniref:Putative mitochondrial protein n=1 Tax=Vitis vinifera TaxID=29760 RepID=A0A438BXL6_VITVI|nr:putative mitochondrial protein [Vitis vinifera]
MDLSTYIGRIASLKEEFLTLMPFTNDQILASPSVPSLDDVFARLLRLSSTQTLSTDSPSDSSVLASQTNSRGGRSGNRDRGQRPQCTYCNKFGHSRDHCYQLHGRPPRTAHIAQSSDTLPSDLTPLRAPHLRVSPLLAVIMMSISDIRQPHQLLLLLCPDDRSTGKTIDIGCDSQGLYHLTSPSSPAACISTDAPLLIHSRWVILVSPSSKDGPSFFHFFVACVDNVREYFSTPFTSFMSQHGILHQSSCAHTPQQNGVAEPCYLINRMPSSILHDQIPHSLIFPTQPLYFLPPRVFGCTCFSYSHTWTGQALPRLRNASSWDTLDFRRAIVVIPLTLIMRSLILFKFIIVDIVLLLLLSLQLSTSETLSHLGWRQAMVDEMAALHSNGKWDLVSLPPGKSTIGCRWVYTVKVGPDGQVDRLKARLVAKGESSLVCKLHRSLYGLKQSPRAWFGRFSSVVQEFGMLRSEADHSVFYHHNSSSHSFKRLKVHQGAK